MSSFVAARIFFESYLDSVEGDWQEPVRRGPAVDCHAIGKGVWRRDANAAKGSLKPLSGIGLHLSGRASRAEVAIRRQCCVAR